MTEKTKRARLSGEEEGARDGGMRRKIQAQELQFWSVLGDVELVETVLKYGAPIDYAEPEFGDTALIKAVMNGQAAVVALLLRCGADITIVNKRPGQCANALEIAMLESTPEIQRMLRLATDALAAGRASAAASLSDAERGEELWFWATEDGVEEVRQLLTAGGILVDARHGALGETALMGMCIHALPTHTVRTAPSARP